MAFPLKSLLDSLLLQKHDWRLCLIRDWPAIVGDLHSKMRLEKVVNDTVIIGVYDSHWMQELYMLSRMIIRTINQKLGGDYVAKLRFILAQTKDLGQPKKIVKNSKRSRSVMIMNAHQRNALKKVKDDQLQEVLHKFFYRCEA